MEIVYCGGCGKVLRGDDFTKGLGRFLDNQPWCSECKPPDKIPIPSATASIKKVGSSAKHPRVTPGTSRREAPSNSKPVFIGLGLAGAAVLIAGFYAASGGSPPPTPPVPDRPVRPTPVIPQPSNVSAEAERALKELESFASLAPPDKILARCEELRSKLRGTPQEKRLREIEASAMDQRKARDQEGLYTKELETLRKLIDEDPRFEKYDEVIQRLKTAKTLAGARAAEIDRRTEEYLKDRKDSPHEKHAGPFAEDEDGFIRNWLILGVFPRDNGKGFEADLLKTEADQNPVDGQVVGSLKWAKFTSTEQKVDFFKVPHLKITKPKDDVLVYAACLVQVVDQTAAEFRFGSDDCGAVWVDGQQVRRFSSNRSLKLDDDRLAVPLSRGVHRVLIKVANLKGGFEFALRVVTPDGQRISSLRVWN